MISAQTVERGSRVQGTMSTCGDGESFMPMLVALMRISDCRQRSEMLSSPSRTKSSSACGKRLRSGPIIAIAIGSGAIGCTIVTDSLFWLVKQYCGASLSETFKYYTTATFIASLRALAATSLLSFII